MVRSGVRTTIHLAFNVNLWIKGALALSEAIAGIAGFFVSPPILISFAAWGTRREFVEDPHDVGANLFLPSIRNLTARTHNFAAI